MRSTSRSNGWRWVTTTIVIEPGWTARLDPNGAYLITTDDSASAA